MEVQCYFEHTKHLILKMANDFKHKCQILKLNITTVRNFIDITRYHFDPKYYLERYFQI